MSETTVSVETVKYEMMGILLPDLGEAGTQSELNELKELIASHGGSVYEESLWGVQDLAYRIKKQDQGFYFVWNLELPTKEISELEKAMNIHQALMRYMIIRIDDDYVLRTTAEYKEEAAQEKAELEAAQEKEEAAAKPRKAPAKAAPKAEKKSDDKLKSIVSDPDISI